MHQNLVPMDTKLSRTQTDMLFPSLQLWNYFWTLWHVLYQPFLQMYTSTHHLTWQGRLAVHQRSWLHLHCFQEVDAKPTCLSCLDLNGNAYKALPNKVMGSLPVSFSVLSLPASWTQRTVVLLESWDIHGRTKNALRWFPHKMLKKWIPCDTKSERVLRVLSHH